MVLGGGVRPEDDPLLPLRAASTAVRAGLPLSPVTVEHLAERCPPLPEPWPPAAREALVDLLGGGPGLIGVWEALDLAGLVVRLDPGVAGRPEPAAAQRRSTGTPSTGTWSRPPSSRSGSSATWPGPTCCCSPPCCTTSASCPAPSTTRGSARRWPSGPSRRMGLAEPDAAVVERLVREHLTLVELATRRDPDDPRTVEALVAAVDGRADVLDLLRALTQADAVAAGPAAWSPWRARLVDDLVARARTALRGGPPPGPAPVTSAEEALVASVLADGRPRVALSAKGLDEMHAVTVVAVDRPGLLADIAGTLAAFRLSVKSALVGRCRRNRRGAADRRRHLVGGRRERRDAVPADAGDRPAPARDGDRSVLDRLARRDASYRPPAGARCGRGSCSCRARRQTRPCSRSAPPTGPACCTPSARRSPASASTCARRTSRPTPGRPSTSFTSASRAAACSPRPGSPWPSPRLVDAGTPP